MKKPLYIIDSFALIFRAYFAFAGRPLTSPDGRNIGAFFGFFKMIFSLIREKKIEHLVLAFDSKTPTFRHEIFPAYKENREAAPQDLLDQLPLIEKAVTHLGFPMVQQDGLEADDLIAALARKCREEDRECFIISGDKDLMQLVGGPVRMLRPDKSGGFAEYGPEEVFADKGVHPHQILDFLSLLGDASDNIPGVKGIGEKTAAKLLGEFGTLDHLYEKLDSLSSASQRSKLEEGRESAYLSRQLASLRDDSELTLEDGDTLLSWNEAEKAREMFKSLGAKSLVTELEVLAPGSGKNSPSKPAQAETQGDLFGEEDPPQKPQGKKGTYRAAATREDIGQIVREARKAGLVAVDLETDSLDPWTARIVGVSLSWEEGMGWYIPFLCPESLPWTPQEALDMVRPLLEDGKVRISGQNFKFDWKVLKAQGVEVPEIWFDTMIAAFILDASSGTYNLEFLARSWLNYPEPIPFTALVPKGKTFADVPLVQATEYAGEDADLTFRLTVLFEEKLRKAGLEDLFFQVDMPVMNLLCRMEWEGIGLNPGELEVYSRELEEKIKMVEQEVFGLVGHSFNLSSPKQLAEVLFTERQLPVVRKTKTGISTDSDVLQELADQDPVPKLVLQYRLYTKLKSTYVDTLPLLVNPKTHRIHTQFIPTGAATGRLASKDPNLQNIPIKDEEGRRIRRAFVPRKGWKFVSADYSQIELVLLAHLSGDVNLCQAFREGQDIHRRTASIIFGVPEAEVQASQRRAAKAVNFGIMYGMSAFRLAGELGIPRAQADSFIKTYFQEFSGIRDFVDRCVREAETSGFSRTLLGRQRPIAAINSRNKTEKMAAERVAVNSPIQGSAADLIKVAMVRVGRRLKAENLQTRLLLQVHDELLLEVPEGEIDLVRSLLREEMEGAAQLSIPLRTSVETADTWGDLH